MGRDYKKNWKRVTGKNPEEAELPNDLIRFEEALPSISGSIVGTNGVDVFSSGSNLVIDAQGAGSSVVPTLSGVLAEGDRTGSSNIVISSGSKMLIPETIGSELGLAFEQYTDTGLGLSLSAQNFDLVHNGVAMLSVSQPFAVIRMQNKIVQGFLFDVSNRSGSVNIAGTSTGAHVSTNIGAPGDIMLTLPLNPGRGVAQCFKNVDGFNMYVKPSGAGAIIWSGGKLADGEWLAASGVGSCIRLVSTINHDWMTISEVGALIPESLS